MPLCCRSVRPITPQPHLRQRLAPIMMLQINITMCGGSDASLPELPRHSDPTGVGWMHECTTDDRPGMHRRMWVSTTQPATHRRAWVRKSVCNTRMPGMIVWDTGMPLGDRRGAESATQNFYGDAAALRSVLPVGGGRAGQHTHPHTHIHTHTHTHTHTRTHTQREREIGRGKGR